MKNERAKNVSAEGATSEMSHFWRFLSEWLRNIGLSPNASICRTFGAR